jgi:predicted nucleotidyltransferase component of viral defense system
MKMLHKADGYARVRTQFIGPLAFPGMIFMDLTFDEPLCLEPESRSVLIHPFPGDTRSVLAYRLEELLAEKLRSLIERGKSRDYHDVWRLLKEHFDKLTIDLFSEVLHRKLAHKGLHVRFAEDFAPADVEQLRYYWDKDLRPQVGTLPPLDGVLSDLHDMLEALVVPLLSRGSSD